MKEKFKAAVFALVCGPAFVCFLMDFHEYKNAREIPSANKINVTVPADDGATDVDSSPAFDN